MPNLSRSGVKTHCHGAAGKHGQTVGAARSGIGHCRVTLRAPRDIGTHGPAHPKSGSGRIPALRRVDYSLGLRLSRCGGLARRGAALRRDCLSVSPGSSLVSARLPVRCRASSAWRFGEVIAPDHAGLVIGFGVVPGRGGAEHGVDAAQHPVFGGDGGALVSPVHGEDLVDSLEPVAGGCGCAVGAFDGDAAQTGARWDWLERGEGPDVGIGSDRDGTGGVLVNAGECDQEVDLVPVRRWPLPDEGIVPFDPLFGLGEGGQRVLQDEEGMDGKVRIEGVAQFRHTMPDMAGEILYDPAARSSRIFRPLVQKRSDKIPPTRIPALSGIRWVRVHKVDR